MLENETVASSAETLQFGAEVSKVLQLMIHSLYTNKDIFLRELISNASDACDKLRYASITEPALTTNDPDLKIRLTYDKKARTLTIADNGIGMGREELIANLGTIAKSGTQEFLGALTGDSKKDMSLIGQFGVGFYSGFMIADRITVTSTRAGQEKTYQWQSTGDGKFTISELTDKQVRGTTITLFLKAEEKEYADAFRLRHIIHTYSDHIAFPIELTDEEGHTETVNKASALWTRPKTEITPEQYTEFYHHAAHSPDEPWLTLHHKAEGKLEYTSLLYIPSIRPFDLFHPDRKRRVKLYVKRVFITEEGIDLIPHYLRFLRGVIDSEDLPLNISRETLQSNPTLTKIREAVAKKILGELKKRADKDAADYAPFWKNFGPVLKEGLCEPTPLREQILEVCRFQTTVGDATTSLDDYISRMKTDQDAIFYLTGERLETLQHNPKLEGFRKRGIEVLLMTDHVDDFWVNVVQDYKGKSLKSITRADIDLDHLSKSDSAEKEEKPAQTPGMESLLASMKSILGDKVSEVRVTNKLTDTAACLAVPEGAMDIRLERFLIEQKQLPAASAKILEINPEHSIVRSLATMTENETKKAELEDIVWLLFDQARIVEGEEIVDPAAFARRLNHFVQKSLAA